MKGVSLSEFRIWKDQWNLAFVDINFSAVLDHFTTTTTSQHNPLLSFPFFSFPFFSLLGIMRAPLLVATAVFGSVSAHFSIVDIRSQIACNISANDGINWLSNPIMEGQPYAEWWMHGQVNCQSKATGSFALPANGKTDIVMSSRVSNAPPPYSTGSFKPSDPDYILSTSQWGDGPDDPGNTLQGHHNIHVTTATSALALTLTLTTLTLTLTNLPQLLH